MNTFHRRRAFTLLLTLGLLLTISQSATSSEVICPIGGQSFTAELDDGRHAVGQNFDFKPYGQGVVTPTPLPVCPDNGFVVYRDDFTPSEISMLSGFVQSPTYQAMVEKHTTYYRLASLLEFQGEPLLIVAFTLLQASWEVDHNAVKYKEYATLAADKFQTYTREGNPTSNDFLTSHIILSELYRRLGQFGKAQRTLDRVKNHKEADKPYTSRIILRLYELIQAHNTEPAPLP